MGNMKIDRFEKKEIIRPAKVEIENMNTILIKDHTDDVIVSYVRVFNDKKKNKELADKIIETIEEFIGVEDE